MRPAPPDWRQSPFFCIQNELSPATLYYTSTSYLAFFTGMKGFGLGGPTFAAFATASGPRVVRAGQEIDTAAMNQCWLLVWFAGAPGWNDWDSPWVVYLQSRPLSGRLTGDGLVLRFAGPAGYALLMPLYGYFKPPQKDKDFLAAHGLKSSDVRTWEWAERLPPRVVHRVQWWAGVLRRFPIYCEESFSVDRKSDTVTLRQRFEWISIEDAWKTPAVKLAPVSPVLAHAARTGFPVKFSRSLTDADLFTPYGPYVGIEGADSYDAVLDVLAYVHETEAAGPPDLAAHPTVGAALEVLRRTARAKFPAADRYQYDHGGLQNFCWAILGDQWYAKALPYYDLPTRQTALASLRRYFHNDVLVAERFKEREFPKDSGRRYLILEGPGIGSWGVLGDAGKFSTNLCETLWAYAHFTGDWELIRTRWELIRRLFCTGAETRWATFGRAEIAEMGDEAAPCLALARMAYRVGDMDTYAYACLLAAQEFTHHWLKMRGANYYRERQPWHSMEFMPEEVYLTNFWGDTAGWQIDGPTYPRQTGERQFENRWVRFKNEDVARFYRDYLGDETRREMDLLTRRWDPKRRTVNDSHIMPSLVQLRSLLLNEKPADLARLATPERFGGPPSGIIASCVAVLRTSRPTQFQRLIPAGEPTPFVAGVQRERAQPGAFLVQSLRCESLGSRPESRRPGWPTVTWWGWKTPSGFDRWVFGSVLPIDKGQPRQVQTFDLNWNSQLFVFALP